MSFKYSGKKLTLLEKPSEDYRSLQQEGLKADGRGTFQASWHSHSPRSAVTAFLQKIGRNGEKPVSPLPP